jgi:type I restriction enzyme R subunit
MITNTISISRLVQEDLSKGILEAIDMESYRNEVKEAMKLSLQDEDAEIAPVA